VGRFVFPLVESQKSKLLFSLVGRVGNDVQLPSSGKSKEQNSRQSGLSTTAANQYEVVPADGKKQTKEQAPKRFSGEPV
jgi:hypothetical protein